MAAIGVAQEFQRVFTATTEDSTGPGAPHFRFAKADRRVIAYYFYVVDEAFGPAFVKICAYFPYPMKIWLNRHEYAKRAAAMAGIGFTPLANGFAATDDPAGLQQICTTLGAGAVRVFCERWWSRLPLPLTEVDRAAGYWWEIAMRQVEVSRTLVFDAPRRARAFVEALCPGDLGLPRRLDHLDEIFTRARDVNRRMVDTFRVGQGCVLASPACERVARPSVEDGRRAPALRFGDPRVRALVGALCASVHAVGGFTNRSLRARVATLLGVPYTQAQTSYDLRRLRLKGLVTRLPHSNTYRLTPNGLRVAGVLRQGPRPAAAPAARRRPAPAATRPPGAAHPRPPRRRPHRAGQNERLRTRLNRQLSSDQGSLAVRG